MMMLVVVSITACSKNTSSGESSASQEEDSMAYSKKAKSIGVSAPTVSSKKHSVASILAKDSIGVPTTHKIPSSCISKNKRVIGKGKFLFNNSRGKGVKKPKYGFSRTVKKTDPGYIAERQKWKPYGNCVACHNANGAKTPGNMGPSLVDYKAHFIDTKARTPEWMFAKISDPRVSNPNTVMTVNHTTFSPNEICAIMSFVFYGK